MEGLGVIVHVVNFLGSYILLFLFAYIIQFLERPFFRRFVSNILLTWV